MPDQPLPVDRQISAREVQDLADADALVAFLARLGYRTEARQAVTPRSLGLEAEATVRPIRRLELVARYEDSHHVYLVEVTSITRKHVRALAQALRDRFGNFVLIVTSDYERLDFVCLERYNRAVDPAQPALFPGAGLGASIRERTWTIERRKPTTVDLRVLRRFSWTEPDSFSQHTKLLGAYDVGFWSSEEFNNRALFSDHFLKDRFTKYEDWQEDPRPVQRRLREVLRDAPRRLSGQPITETWHQLYQPVLEALGFADGLEPAGLEREPFSKLELRALLGEASGPLLLAFPWGRFLDGRDESGRDPETGELNPGALVVSLLEREQVPWIVLTNGRLWRLYSRRAHSRATNYYEIDLEEILAPEGTTAASPGDSFRYFWLLFRRRAFEPRTIARKGHEAEESLLDQLFLDSQEYTRALGERLKDKVFVEVFPTLAGGFARYWESTEPGKEVSQDELDQIYRGTLTLLYRLLFLLYAEARDLLPVRETADYHALSLDRLRQEVAAAAGPIVSEVPERLRKKFSPQETDLYERLLELFAVIDLGNTEVNVPSYNGGLFLSRPSPEDSRAEAEAARFLLRLRVDDLALATALDRLARDEDDKTAQLVFVDYKSLGVRQLGSIYEGLLEFRLRRANETMAIVKGNRTEEVHPLRHARDRGLTITRVSRGRDAKERLIEVGDTYLENDHHERKKSGVYYTPDFVVSYIVQKTLGPPFEHHLEALRPRLREAEKWHRRQKQEAAAKKEPVGKYDFGPAVENQWQDLLTELFDFTVLDPSMGSGHFLVEVVDFLTDRMLDFLAAFPWNPVFAHVQFLRQTIVSTLEKQGLSLDDRRLTDVNLVKRHVLKRCVYGVDLNPMAVELAKVSLWLDCFTLGAPLSFLDHHLKWGNSLVGFEVEQVRSEIEGEGSGTGRQLGLFGGRFAGLQLATAGMAVVGGMPDITTEQVHRSKEAFDHASEVLGPFVRILDLYTSRWFLDAPGAAAKTARKGKARKAAVDLLQRPELEGFLTAASAASAQGALAKLPADLRQEVEAGLEVAARLRFFHWDLAFPEVFYRRKAGTERQVTRLPGFGFHAVVGNPPWVRQESVKAYKPALQELFSEVFKSEADLYVYFLARSPQLLATGGRLGMLVPNKWFKAEYADSLRHYLNAELEPEEVVDFGHAPLFEGADTFPAILLLSKPAPSQTAGKEKPETPTGEIGFVRVGRDDLPIHDLEAYNRTRRVKVARARLKRSEWELLPAAEAALMDKIRGAGVPLVEYVGSSPYRGVLTGFNEAFLIDQETRDRLVAEDPGCTEIIKPFLRGENIRRWHSPWGGEWMIFARRGIDIEKYPSVRAHLLQFRKALEPKPEDWDEGRNGKWPGRKSGAYKWFELQDTIDYFRFFEVPKIVYQEIQFHSRFALDRDGLLLNNKGFMIPVGDLHLLGVLNSALLWWYIESFMSHMKDGAHAMQGYRFEQLPIARIPQSGNSKVALLASELVTHWAGVEVTGAKQEPDRQRKTWELEIALHHAVFDLYGLTADEIALLRRTAPARDPLLLAERELAALEKAGHG